MDAGREHDMLLFECSLWLNPSVAPPCFSVSLTRQLTHRDDDDEFGHFEHVGLTLEYPPDEGLREISTMRSERFGTADLLWGTGAGGAADWCAQVEATRSFATLPAHRAIRAEIGRGDL
jgi:hypothetical protein